MVHIITAQSYRVNINPFSIKPCEFCIQAVYYFSHVRTIRLNDKLETVDVTELDLARCVPSIQHV
jgi:hypothetical protein